jgi:hypothetical protein
MTITRHPTRRALLLGSGALAASVFPPTAAVAATDRELMALLAGVEQLQVERYSALLDTFADADFAAEGFPDGTRALLETVLRAEEAQLAVLDGRTTALVVDAVAHNLRGALASVLDLENVAVAAYAGVIPRLGRQGLIPEMVGIHSVEARHAAWLASLLGAQPFGSAVDTPLSPGEVVTRLEAMMSTPRADATPAVTDDGASLALAAIAADLGVSETALQVDSVAPRDWPDTALGCPREGEFYAQVITPGYRIVVNVEGEEIVYHTDREGAIVRCP